MQSNEASEFPILCEACLGPNPYVRMTRKPNAKECKICLRGFTMFSWCPGAGPGQVRADVRYRHTEICQTCARVKNVCQTCILDLEYKISTQVRDTVLAEGGAIVTPKQEANRDFFIATQAKLVDGPLGEGPTAGGRADSAAKQMLRSMARNQPFHSQDRGKGNACAFFAKGHCTRGQACPFRHDRPGEGRPSRPAGRATDPPTASFVNTPYVPASGVAGKPLEPPADPEITTLYLSGVTEQVGQADLRRVFEVHGVLRSVVVLPKSLCAFVTFDSRQSAEQAAAALHDKLTVRGVPLSLAWGRPRRGRVDDPNASYGRNMAAPGSAPATMSMDQLLAMGDATILPPAAPASAGRQGKEEGGRSRSVYPSQNPMILGTSSRSFRST